MKGADLSRPMPKVFNLSSKYNLGAEKIRAWLAEDPQRGSDTVFISAIFTWELPAVARAANAYKDRFRVEIGGPGPSLMPDWVYERTGIQPHVGIDDRFERQSGSYQYTITSRGCPRRCPHCAVPQLEPHLIEYDSFPVAPVIGDNNLLATSWQH